MAEKLIVDCGTGAETFVPLTPSELAEREQAAIDDAANYEREQVERANRSALGTRMDEALVDLRAIVNSSGNLSSAQLSNAVRLLARVAIAVVRLMRDRLDGTD